MRRIAEKLRPYATAQLRRDSSKFSGAWSRRQYAAGVQSQVAVLSAAAFCAAVGRRLFDQRSYAPREGTRRIASIDKKVPGEGTVTNLSSCAE